MRAETKQAKMPKTAVSTSRADRKPVVGVVTLAALAGLYWWLARANK
ncbi:hypothetical protein [Lacticaseibacillus hegangensis]|uniref:Uncharacterized protein n=1 Tax=Lacticaseibacillus hegangensis TaxID=2486010 RepID=A0ABW4CYF1_9LACO|nr:hypothetical protein [Lacticaseibacillus hegangensis]